MGNKVTKYKIDGDKTTVIMFNKAYKIKAVGTVKVHEDDKDFANDLTGRRLAKYKADSEYNKKMAKAKQREAQALRAIAQQLDNEAVEHLQISGLAKAAYDETVQLKTELYEKFRKNRETGGYQPTHFEQLGELTKGLTDEQKIEIVKQIVDGGNLVDESGKND